MTTISKYLDQIRPWNYYYYYYRLEGIPVCKMSRNLCASRGKVDVTPDDVLFLFYLQVDDLAWKK